MPEWNYSDQISLMRKTAGFAVLVFLGISGVVWLGTRGARDLHGSRMEANAASAKGSLRLIMVGLDYYQHEYSGYPDSLERLRGWVSGTPREDATPEGAQLLEDSRAHSVHEHSGYIFRYVPFERTQRKVGEVVLFGRYELTASPAKPEITGRWFYYCDSSGVIRQKEGAAAGSSDPPVP